MAVRALRRPPATRVRVSWSNPPTRRLTIVRGAGDHERQRTIGLRGLVALDEAAAVLRVSEQEVRRAVDAGELQPRARGGESLLVLDDVVEYASDRRLIARSDKVERRIAAGQERVLPWPKARRRR